MKIRELIRRWGGILILGFGLVNVHAWEKVGHVFCDANGNKCIDPGDVPVQGVLVVVQNTSGTFSNAAWTAADGSFSIALRDVPDSYSDFIHPGTLPEETVSVSPAMGQFSTTANMQTVTNCFLIDNPECKEEKACWLTGGGTIRNVRGQPLFTFGGNVNPGCSPTAGEGGNWNVVAHALGLHFQGTAIEVLDCGNIPGIPPGSTSPKTPFNFIDFQGTGSIKGIGLNKTKLTPVLFTGRAEDRAEPGAGVDRLYLRVFTAQGRTLLLISGAPATPAVISPVRISTGNLQIHVSSCDNPPF